LKKLPLNAVSLGASQVAIEEKAGPVILPLAVRPTLV
jgi:hypothetical protein